MEVAGIFFHLYYRFAELNQLYNDLSVSNDKIQIQVNNLLTEMSQLKTTLEETESQKMLLEKLKKNLEDRLDEIHEQYHDASQNKHAAEKNLSALDKEVFDLKQLVEEHQDSVNVLSEKLKKVEASLVNSQTELTKEKEENQELIKSKVKYILLNNLKTFLALFNFAEVSFF